MTLEEKLAKKKQQLKLIAAEVKFIEAQIEIKNSTNAKGQQATNPANPTSGPEV